MRLELENTLVRVAEAFATFLERSGTPSSQFRPITVYNACGDEMTAYEQCDEPTSVEDLKDEVTEELQELRSRINELEAINNRRAIEATPEGQQNAMAVLGANHRSLAAQVDRLQTRFNELERQRDLAPASSEKVQNLRELVDAVITDQGAGFDAAGRALIALRERVETLEQRPDVTLVPDTSHLPTRDEITRLAIEISGMRTENAELRRQMEQARSWRGLIENTLGIRTRRP